MGNSVTTPLGVIRPILFTVYSVNQRLPSGPDAMSPDELPLGMRNSVTTPLGVMRPILFGPLLSSANQTLPSGPAVISLGLLLGVGTGKDLTEPLVVIRPILFALNSVNQRLPSGPDVIARALPLRWGSGNSWILSASAKTGGTHIKPLKVSK